MPEFLPFAGIRYDCDATGAELGILVAPPYDVVDEEEHAALEAAHPLNSVRLILPRDEHAEGDRYARAATLFATWQREGVLVADPTPRFYAYRMEYRDDRGRARHTRGVIGALGLPEAGADDILPHERTLPKAKSDRLSLLQAMRVNVDPIWGLTLGAGLTALLDRATPLASCTDENDVRHELGAIDDPDTVGAVTRIVGEAPLVLADGHHRFETALNYRAERRAAGIDDPGAAAIMCFVVELVDDELWIEPIHRLVDLPAGVDLRAALADAFTITDAGPITPENVDALTDRMRDGGRARPRRRSRPRARDPPPPKCVPPRSRASTRPSPPPTPRWSRPSSSPGSRARRGSTATTRPPPRPRSTRAARVPRSSARR